MLARACKSCWDENKAAGLGDLKVPAAFLAENSGPLGSELPQEVPLSRALSATPLPHCPSPSAYPQQADEGKGLPRRRPFRPFAESLLAVIPSPLGPAKPPFPPLTHLTVIH